MHEWPHEPQFALSELKSTHAPPHAMAHGTHAPPVHDEPGAQEWPHEPQLVSSPVKSVHAPPQTVEHGMHAPLAQT